MRRNIRPLSNCDPPATEDEGRASALQFVRKVSGFTKPSKANEDAFNQAVDEVNAAARTLVGSLVGTARPPGRRAAHTRAVGRARGRGDGTPPGPRRGGRGLREVRAGGGEPV